MPPLFSQVRTGLRRGSPGHFQGGLSTFRSGGSLILNEALPMREKRLVLEQEPTTVPVLLTVTWGNPLNTANVHAQSPVPAGIAPGPRTRIDLNEPY